MSWLRYVSEARAQLDALGVTDTELRLRYLLATENGGWSISSLSDASGISRVTVRRFLREAKAQGEVRQDDAGWRETPKGRRRLMSMAEAAVTGARRPLLAFHARLARECPALAGKG